MRAKGFSLIEIIVAVGVFTVVAMLTVGSLLILTAAEKRVASVQANQDNVRFAMIEMTREIRYGTEYNICSSNATNQETCFSVINADGETIQYKVSEKPTDCSFDAKHNCVMRSVNGGIFHPVTGSDINISRLNFYLFGVDINDTEQPRVTIILQGKAQEGTPNETIVNLQTTISMLQIDMSS